MSEKLATFNSHVQETAIQVSKNIAHLNNHLAAALKHQAWVRINPDGVVPDGFVEQLGNSVDELLEKFDEINSKSKDLEDVKNGVMTAQELVLKYNIDLASYSESLS